MFERRFMYAKQFLLHHTRHNLMPPKKIAWGHVPNNEFVKKKDESDGKWIECVICCVAIRVRASYGFTEWEHHCSFLKHCQKVHVLFFITVKIQNYYNCTTNIKKGKLLMNLFIFIMRKEFGAPILLNAPMKQSEKELVNILIN